MMLHMSVSVSGFPKCVPYHALVFYFEYKCGLCNYGQHNALPSAQTSEHKYDVHVCGPWAKKTMSVFS